MDPNANLQEQMEFITDAIGYRDMDQELLDQEELQEVLAKYLSLCELIEALNEWIRKGGFLPEVWQREQDKLSSEYLKATLSETFPWLLEIKVDGEPTEDFEEPSGADVIQDLGELWTEVISDQTLNATLVPLDLHERHLLGLMVTKLRENIGEPWAELAGFGEDNLYSTSFDILRKLDGQPQPPQAPHVSLDPPPFLKFRTEDGYLFEWDHTKRLWMNAMGDCYHAGGWTFWPFDFRGIPVPGDLL